MCVRVLPVNEVKVFLKVSWVNMGFAQLKMSPRVVMNVVDTHFLHDAKTSLRRPTDLKGDKKKKVNERREDYEKEVNVVT